MLARVEDAGGIGVIEPGRVLTLAEFLARVGWGVSAWRAARLDGLQPVKIGRRAYIRSDDFLAYVDRVAAKQAAAAKVDA